MKFSIVQSTALGCIFVRSAGVLDPGDMRTMIQSVSTLDLYRAGVPILHDMRRVDFDVPMSSVLQVARTQPDQPKHANLVLVADTELAYGMLRALVTIRENAQRTASVFRTIAEALDWLAIPGLTDAIPEEVEASLSASLGDSQAEDGFSLEIRKLTGNGTPGTV